MKTLGDIIDIVVDTAVKRGVVYLLEIGVPETVERQCINCLRSQTYLICLYCQLELGIRGNRDDVELGISYSVHMGHEVDIATGWPVRETFPCTNE